MSRFADIVGNLNTTTIINDLQNNATAFITAVFEKYNATYVENMLENGGI
jgi:hypothetical protein